MNGKIRQLIDQIAALEDELQSAIEQQEDQLRYRMEGRRVVFEQTVRETHQRIRLGVFRWFMTVRPLNYLTMPVIYGASLPLLLFDLAVTLYQWICFPIYRIAIVKRRDYIVYDHQHLAYLNLFEKAHCLYCSYAVGMIAYAQEVVARTEQYFCPIKHARKVHAAHSRYKHFLNYGEADDFHARLEAFRAELARERETTPATQSQKEQP